MAPGQGNQELSQRGQDAGRLGGELAVCVDRRESSMEHHGRSLLSFALPSVRRGHAPPDMRALLALAVQYHILWSQHVGEACIQPQLRREPRE